MYTTLNYSYGEYKNWIGDEYSKLVEYSKTIRIGELKCRIYCVNLNDVPVVEIVFYETFILVMEIGTANIIKQIPILDIFTIEHAEILTKIIDQYNETFEEECNHGHRMQFEFTGDIPQCR